MKLKTIKQTCETCEAEFETVLDTCIVCYVTKYKHLLLPKKTRWQQFKRETWAFFFTVPIYAVIYRCLSVEVLIIFIIGLAYGTFLEQIINFFDRKF